jgi:hypothetical protein
MKDLKYNKEENHFEWQDERLGIKCSGILELMVIKKALDSKKAFRAIWNLQNGYGIAGFTPPQGYDWSGIRDSSPEAIHKMYLAAVKDNEALNLAQKLAVLKHGEFAGRTPTGSKIHRCTGHHTSTCYDYTSNRAMYYSQVDNAIVHKKALCKKCWGSNPTADFLAVFNLELINS